MPAKHIEIAAQILAHLPDPILIINPQCQVIYSNPAAQSTLRIHSDDHLLEHVFDTDKLVKFLNYCASTSSQIPGRISHGRGKQMLVFGCRLSWDLPGHEGLVMLRYDQRMQVAQKFASLNTDLETLKRLVERSDRERQRLNRLARYDALTEALNRRAFMEVLEKECAASPGGQPPLSLALLDLDNFKALNDTYGHAGGDKVLKHFSFLCRSAICENDIFARIGGEEFAILMPRTECGDAVIRIEALFNRLRMSSIRLNNRNVAYTTSAGISCLVHDDTPDSLLERADKHLYRSKDTGRDRLTSDLDFNRQLSATG